MIWLGTMYCGRDVWYLLVVYEARQRIRTSEWHLAIYRVRLIMIIMEWTWWQLGENICFHWAYDECLNSLIHFMGNTLELPKLCERLFICAVYYRILYERYCRRRRRPRSWHRNYWWLVIAAFGYVSGCICWVLYA